MVMDARTQLFRRHDLYAYLLPHFIPSSKADFPKHMYLHFTPYGPLYKETVIILPMFTRRHGLLTMQEDFGKQIGHFY